MGKLKTFDINELRGQNYTWLGVTVPLLNLEYSINLNEILKHVCITLSIVFFSIFVKIICDMIRIGNFLS